ncbi:hypothetical protein [Vibrio phage vB_VibM_10AMN]|uniref:Uncharacterized protein n=1 Tax=Staphylococcus phage vB_VibM_10AMN12 TaxID=3076785 RepID=A0AA96KT24_9CAUD|nr:hypothetical protein [Vibrio phage vB_VibM_10AMN]WNO47478.1 hypothetical protein [Staphylococcus phage vB_VibM_10AMN12]
MKVKIFVIEERHGNYWKEYEDYRYMLKINRTNLLSQRRYNDHYSAIRAGERFCKQNGWEIYDE